MAATPQPSPASSELTTLLEQLKTGHAALVAVALISIEGRFLASTSMSGILRVRIGAISAASAAIGRKGATDLEMGALKHVHIQGDLGSALLVEVTGKAVLTLLVTGQPPLDAILQDVNRMVPRVRFLL